MTYGQNTPECEMTKKHQWDGVSCGEDDHPTKGGTG